MANCTDNFQCNPYETNRLCYAGVATVETDANGCGCNLFWGWTGPNCDELGPTSYMNIAGSSVSIALSCVIVLVTLRLLVLERYSKRGLHSRNSTLGGRAPNHKSVCAILKSDRGLTIFLALLSTLFAIMWGVCRILSTVFTSGQPIFGLTVEADQLTRTDYGNFGRFNVLQEYVAMPGSLTFGFLAIVNIAFVWLEIASSSKQLIFAKDNPAMRRKRRFLRVVQFLSVALVVAANILDRFTNRVNSLVGFVFLPLCLAVALLFFVGYKNLTGLLTSTGGMSFTSVVYNVRVTAIICSMCMIGFGASWFTVSLLDNIIGDQETAGVWPVEITAILENLVILSIGLGQFGVARFLWRSREKPERKNISLATGATTLNDDEGEHYESITQSSKHAGPPISRRRRIKSPKDKRLENKASTLSGNESYASEQIRLPGEEEDDDEEPYVPQPYENVRKAPEAGPPMGKTRRIKSPRMKREEEAASQAQDTLVTTSHTNEFFKDDDDASV